MEQSTSSSTTKPTKRFRLQGKGFYLTFPQSGDTTKEQVLSRLQERFGDHIEWAVVGAEKHLSGDPHLHIAFRCKDKQQINRADYFDYLTGKHGNYQTMKKPSECVSYCIKDGNFLEFQCDAKKMAAGKQGVMTLIYNDIKDGASFHDIFDTYGSVAGQNKRKLEEIIGYVTERKRIKLLSPWRTCRSSTIESRPVAKWLNDSIKNPDFFPRKADTDYRMLYISGPPAIGKTTLMHFLSKSFRVYLIPSDEDYYDEWRDKDYDVAILDEFTGNKPINWMNRWMGGQAMTIRRKGIPGILKFQPIPTIVMSNRTLESAYQKYLETTKEHDTFGALRTRFTEISLSRPFTITFRDDDIPVESTEQEVQPTLPESTTTAIDPGPTTTTTLLEQLYRVYDE